MQQTSTKEHIRCLIIGSGPAGFTAAIYAGRANLNPVVYEGMEPGGQLTTTTDIENFPGYPEGTGGSEMMEDLRNQAKRFNTDVRWGQITKADLSSSPYQFVVDGEKEIEADAVIIATGAKAKYLGLADEAKYNGAGVSACATCDGFFYRKKMVAVVGGGDTACEDALYLSKLCAKVYIIVRKNCIANTSLFLTRLRRIDFAKNCSQAGYGRNSFQSSSGKTSLERTGANDHQCQSKNGHSGILCRLVF